MDDINRRIIEIINEMVSDSRLAAFGDVVGVLLDRYNCQSIQQSAVTEVGNEGKSLIHMAMEANVPDDVMDYLITSVSNVVPVGSIKSSDGNSVIHNAVKYSASEHVISKIMTLDPLSCIEKNSNAETMLHVAAVSNSSRNIVKVILESVNWLHQNDPSLPDVTEFCQMKTVDGYTSLHLAILHNSSLGFIEELTAACPLSVSQNSSLGLSAIHLGCFVHASLDLLKVLIKAAPNFICSSNGSLDMATITLLARDFPKQMQYFDFDGAFAELLSFYSVIENLTPLHCACIMNSYASEQLTTGINFNDFIQYLVNIGVESLQVPNSVGDLPVHIAIACGASKDVIRLLTCGVSLSYVDDSKSPTTLMLSHRNNRGDNALQLSIKCNSPFEVVELLCGSGDEICLQGDRDEYLPLHNSIIWRSSLSVIQLLLSVCPRSCEVRDKTGNTALHLAAKDSSLEIVHSLADINMKACLAVNDSGNTPLHRALAYNTDFYVVTYLLSVCPEACQVANKDGEFPLHIAVSYGCPANVLQTLIECFRSALTEQNVDGHIPLHLALVHLTERPQPRFPLIQQLVSSSPSSVLIRSYDGNLPLQHFLASKISCYGIEEIQENVINLLDVYENASIQQNNRRETSLHLVMGPGNRDCTDEVMVWLIETLRDCIMIPNIDGYLPIHVACSNHHSPRTIECLLECQSACSLSKNNEGRLPVHLLFMNDCSLGDASENALELHSDDKITGNIAINEETVIENHYATRFIQCLDSFKALAYESLVTPDDDGNLMLHAAMKSDVPELVVDWIVRNFPDSCTARNRSGNTPIHRGLAYLSGKTGFDNLFKLIIAHPQACSITNNDEEMPLHIAVAYGLPADIIRATVNAFPPALSHQNVDGMTPLHLAVKESASEDIVQMIIEAHKQLITSDDSVRRDDLCLVADLNGDTPLHLAVRQKAKEDIISCLLGSCPTATNVQNHQLLYPIHLACAEYQNLNIFSMLLKADEKSIKYRAPGGSLPLHAFIAHLSSLVSTSSVDISTRQVSVTDQTREDLRNYANTTCNIDQAPVDYLNRLIDGDPNALECPDNNGNLPIHLACQLPVLSVVVIRTLLNRYRESGKVDALATTNNDGQYPLHIILRTHQFNSKSHSESLEFLSSVLLVLESFPRAATHKPHGLFHQHPLLLTLQRRLPLSIVEAFIEVMNSFQTSNKNSAIQNDTAKFSFHVGNLSNLHSPFLDVSEDSWGFLHFAIRYESPFSVIEALVKACPQLCESRNNVGWTALHLTLSSLKPSKSVVSSLGGSQSNIQGGLVINPSNPVLLATGSSKQMRKSIRITTGNNKPPSVPHIQRAVQQLKTAPGQPIALSLFQADGNNLVEIANMMIDLIVGTNPTSLLVRDLEGNTAVHSAISHDCPLPILRHLISVILKFRDRLSPWILLAKNVGELTIFDMLLRSSHRSLELLKPILLSDLPIAVHRDEMLNDALRVNKVSRHGYSWSKFLLVWNSSEVIYDINEFIDFLEDDVISHYDCLTSDSDIQSVIIVDGSTVKNFRLNSTNVRRFIANILFRCLDDQGQPVYKTLKHRVLKDYVLFTYILFCGRFDNLHVYCPFPNELIPIDLNHLEASHFSNSRVLFCDDYGVREDYWEAFHIATADGVRSNIAIKYQYPSTITGGRIGESPVNVSPANSGGRELDYDEFVASIRYLITKRVIVNDLIPPYVSFRHADRRSIGRLNWEDYELFMIENYGESRAAAIRFYAQEEEYKHAVALHELLNSQLVDDKSYFRNVLTRNIEGMNYSMIGDNFKYHIVTLQQNSYLSPLQLMRSVGFDYKYTTIWKIVAGLVDRIDNLHRDGVVLDTIDLNNLNTQNNIAGMSTFRVDIADYHRSVAINASGGCLGRYSTSESLHWGKFPPEMFVELKSNDDISCYEKYWKENSIDWKAVLRKSYFVVVVGGRRHVYVPRIAVSANKSLLPYAIATPIDQAQIDDMYKYNVWQIGLVLYELLAEKPFLPITSDGDIDPDCTAIFFNVMKGRHNRGIIYRKIESLFKSIKVGNIKRERDALDNLLDLLQLLLDPNVKTRPTTRQVREFISKRELIEGEKSNRLVEEEYHDVTAIIETSLSQSSRRHHREVLSQLSEEASSRLSFIDQSIASVRNLFSSEVNHPNLIVIAKSRILSQADSARDSNGSISPDTWLNGLLALLDVITQPTNAPKDQRFQRLCDVMKLGRKSDGMFWLHLIDEYSFEAVTGDHIYPLPLAMESLVMLFPLFRLSLKQLALVYSVPALGKFFGYPDKELTDSTIEAVSRLIGSLDAAEVRREFKIMEEFYSWFVHFCLLENADGPKNQDLIELCYEELKVVYDEYDPYRHYAGLSQIEISIHHHQKLLWSSEKNLQIIRFASSDGSTAEKYKRDAFSSESVIGTFNEDDDDSNFLNESTRNPTLATPRSSFRMTSRSPYTRSRKSFNNNNFNSSFGVPHSSLYTDLFQIGQTDRQLNSSQQLSPIPSTTDSPAVSFNETYPSIMAEVSRSQGRESNVHTLMTEGLDNPLFDGSHHGLTERSVRFPRDTIRSAGTSFADSGNANMNDVASSSAYGIQITNITPTAQNYFRYRSVAPLSSDPAAPPTLASYLTKKSLLPIFSDRLYYFVLSKGALTYYARHSPSNPAEGIDVQGTVSKFKWRVIESYGRSVKIRGAKKISVDIRFDDIDLRDIWIDALRKHIDYARLHA